MARPGMQEQVVPEGATVLSKLKTQTLDLLILLHWAIHVPVFCMSADGLIRIRAPGHQIPCTAEVDASFPRSGHFLF